MEKARHYSSCLAFSTYQNPKAKSKSMFHEIKRFFKNYSVQKNLDKRKSDGSYGEKRFVLCDETKQKADFEPSDCQKFHLKNKIKDLQIKI